MIALRIFLLIGFVLALMSAFFRIVDAKNTLQETEAILFLLIAAVCFSRFAIVAAVSDLTKIIKRDPDRPPPLPPRRSQFQ